MKVSMRTSVSLLAICGLLGACGDRAAPDEDAARAAEQARQQALVAAAGAEAELGANFINAVSAGKSTAPVNVKFDIRSRPEVGQPVEVELAVVPVAPDLERIGLTFQTPDGLSISGGGSFGDLQRPLPGKIAKHVLTITPGREGAYTITVVALADSKDSSLARVFAIPLLVGPPLPAAAAPAAGSAGGGSPGGA
ncbi:MAG: hypothetical protein R3E77_06410 [Steroidobacteraceae bacterium]